MVRFLFFLIGVGGFYLTGCTTQYEKIIIPQISADGGRLLPGLIALPGKGIFFKPGATQEEVRAVMGDPTRKVGNRWYYGDSEVDFSVSVAVPVVVGYRIRSYPLKIYDKDPFLWP